VIAFVLAAGATAGVFLYVNGVKSDNKATSTNMATVIVSKRAIEAGTKLDTLIAAGDFTTVQVPADAVVPGAVTELSQLQGRSTNSFILQGEQISTARLQGSTAPTGGVLGIPEGYEAVSVQLEPQRVVGGVIQTGDHVVVYATSDSESGSGSATVSATRTSSPAPGTVTATVKAQGVSFPGATLTLVPDVQVLQVQGGSSGGALSSSGSNAFVTLALKPHDAAAVVAAQAQGFIWLALLPPQGHGRPQGPVFIGG
jgi:pilus assembly protein CpaB